MARLWSVVLKDEGGVWSRHTATMLESRYLHGRCLCWGGGGPLQTDCSKGPHRAQEQQCVKVKKILKKSL